MASLFVQKKVSGILYYLWLRMRGLSRRRVGVLLQRDLIVLTNDHCAIISLRHFRTSLRRCTISVIGYFLFDTLDQVIRPQLFSVDCNNLILAQTFGRIP